MRPIFFLTFCLCTALYTDAQVSDFLRVRKPNGRSVKTYFAGSTISLITRSGIPLWGTIKTMRNDTLFISTYNTRVVPTMLGVTVVDTFGHRVERIYFKEIARLEIFSKHRSIYGKLGSVATIGGSGYILLNVFNGINTGESIGDKDNLTKITTAAGIAVAGQLVSWLFRDNRYTQKKHRIEYISLQ